jgi:hypothetical protein
MLPTLVIGHFISVPNCVHHGDVAHGAGAYEPSSLVDAQHHRSYFQMLSRFIDSEIVETSNLDWRGMLAGIGIIKAQPFEPDDTLRQFSTARRRPPSGCQKYWPLTSSSPSQPLIAA